MDVGAGQVETRGRLAGRRCHVGPLGPRNSSLCPSARSRWRLARGRCPGAGVEDTKVSFTARLIVPRHPNWPEGDTQDDTAHRRSLAPVREDARQRSPGLLPPPPPRCPASPRVLVPHPQLNCTAPHFSQTPRGFRPRESPPLVVPSPPSPVEWTRAAGTAYLEQVRQEPKPG